MPNTPPASPKVEIKTEEQNATQHTEQEQQTNSPQNTQSRNPNGFFNVGPRVALICPEGHLHLLDMDSTLLFLLTLAERIEVLDLNDDLDQEEEANQAPQSTTNQNTEQQQQELSDIEEEEEQEEEEQEGLSRFSFN